jgi:hypothetical protein
MTRHAYRGGMDGELMVGWTGRVVRGRGFAAGLERHYRAFRSSSRIEAEATFNLHGCDEVLSWVGW